MSISGNSQSLYRTQGMGTSFHDNQSLPAHEVPGNARTAKSTSARTARRYAIAAAGCALFALVYAQFSHGVHSPFMTFMFAIPLIGGVLPATVRSVAKAQPLPRVTRQAWALGVACLTIASCLKGIFDIAGTASELLVVYVLATIVLLIVAAVGFLRETQQKA